MRIAMMAVMLVKANAWMGSAQRWPSNASGLWRPEAIAVRGGVLSALWEEPASRNDFHALGGGISYAWDPSLCDKLLGKFDENIYGFEFISCGGLRAAVERAFASWEANHPLIRFHDVSEECNSTYGWPTDSAGFTLQCPISELWITAASNASGYEEIGYEISTYNWCAECGFDPPCVCSLPLLLLTALHPTPLRTRYFRKTNGKYTRELGVYATVRATIAFNTDVCWYLDSTFCSGFHSWKASLGADTALQLGRILIFAIWTLAFVESIYSLLLWIRVHLDLLALEVVGLLDVDKVQAAHQNKLDDSAPICIRVPPHLHLLSSHALP